MMKCSALSFQVTKSCNLRCDYCFNKSINNEKISPEVVDLSFNLFDYSKDIKKWHVNLFGGEPLTNKEGISKICEKAGQIAENVDKHVSFSLTTNGTLFDKNAQSLIEKYKISVQLSMDGDEVAHNKHRKFPDGKGSYSSIMENFERLKSSPNFRVRLTVTPETVRTLYRSVLNLIERGVSRIAVSPNYEDHWTENSLDIYFSEWLKVGALVASRYLSGEKILVRGFESLYAKEKLIKKNDIETRVYACGAGESFLFISTDGGVYPCHRFPGYFNNNQKYLLGNVETGIDYSKLKKIRISNERKKRLSCRLINELKMAKGSENICLSCTYYKVCKSSCMASNAYIFGDLRQSNSVASRINLTNLVVLSQVAEYINERRI